MPDCKFRGRKVLFHGPDFLVWRIFENHEVTAWRHDIQRNDTQHNDIQYKNSQRKQHTA
jgi:hypothetical protein